MKTADLISRLKKVKKTGPRRWVACCPAHADKTPSMVITETDKTVLVHCFSGCSTEEILGAVGMTFDDLYPDHRELVRPGKIPISDALRCIAFEALVVTASAGTMRDRPLTEEEMARLVQASGRIQAAMTMSGVSE
jgi:hypothetical protein